MCFLRQEINITKLSVNFIINIIDLKTQNKKKVILYHADSLYQWIR